MVGRGEKTNKNLKIHGAASLEYMKYVQKPCSSLYMNYMINVESAECSYIVSHMSHVVVVKLQP